jgi:ATP-dependent RNA helicase RhlE
MESMRRRSTLSTNKKEMMKPELGFAGFELHASLNKGLLEAGFSDPRPIQAKTIPAGMEGRDVLGLAQTGTGKTAAFALPILDQRIRNHSKGPTALILAPTRELANQIDAEIRMLAKFTSMRTVTVFGGKSIKMQAQALRRHPEIIVGCPGRVLDLLKQGELDLGRIRTVVLDEADHMFDMGFLPDVKRILSACPDERQNLLFSATMPKEIRHLADRMLLNPQVVELAHSAPADRIEHVLAPVPQDQKRDLLESILKSDDCQTAIVFTRTKHRARQMAVKLDKQGHSAVALQGNMSQGQRDRAMDGFRKGKFDILVATDIAARGLDVAGVSYVINFDPPSTPETYTHRIGRTGRAELSGKAVTFVTREDREWIRDTERYLKAPILRQQFDGIDAEDLDAPSSQPAAATKPKNSNSRKSYGQKPALQKSRQRKPQPGGSGGRRSGPGRARDGASAKAGNRSRG